MNRLTTTHSFKQRAALRFIVPLVLGLVPYFSSFSARALTIAPTLVKGKEGAHDGETDSPLVRIMLHEKRVPEKKTQVHGELILNHKAPTTRGIELDLISAIIRVASPDNTTLFQTRLRPQKVQGNSRYTFRIRRDLVNHATINIAYQGVLADGSDAGIRLQIHLRDVHVIPLAKDKRPAEQAEEADAG